MEGYFMKLKKLTAVILAAILMISVLGICGFAEGTDSLKFNNGEFKIMIFTDVHETVNSKGCATQIMREALDKCKPDLVVLLGDNSGGDTLAEHETVIERITAPMRERNIPYAAIFGNHDDQVNGVTKEALLALYQKYDCISYDAIPELYGCGNFNLPIMSSDGSKVKFNLWFIDSGTYNPDKTVGGYDYIREDQIAWYKETAAKLKEANGGETVPALNFQHITVPEVYDVLYPEFSLDLGKASSKYNGKIYSLIPRFGGYTGFVFEPPQPPYNDPNGQFAAWKEVGDIMASFSGHDHVNSFKANVDGIDIVGVPTVHNNRYSSDLNRGAGLVTIKEDATDTYEYELIRASDLALDRNSKICDVEGSTSKIGYYFAQKFADACLIFQRVINKLFYKL